MRVVAFIFCVVFHNYLASRKRPHILAEQSERVFLCDASLVSLRSTLALWPRMSDERLMTNNVITRNLASQVCQMNKLGLSARKMDGPFQYPLYKWRPFRKWDFLVLRLGQSGHCS